MHMTAGPAPVLPRNSRYNSKAYYTSWRLIAVKQV
jgi:hypothetical protein